MSFNPLTLATNAIELDPASLVADGVAYGTFASNTSWRNTAGNAVAGVTITSAIGASLVQNAFHVRPAVRTDNGASPAWTIQLPAVIASNENFRIRIVWRVTPGFTPAGASPVLQGTDNATFTQLMNFKIDNGQPTYFFQNVNGTGQISSFGEPGESLMVTTIERVAGNMRYWHGSRLWDNSKTFTGPINEVHLGDVFGSSPSIDLFYLTVEWGSDVAGATQTNQDDFCDALAFYFDVHTFVYGVNSIARGQYVSDNKKWNALAAAIFSAAGLNHWSAKMYGGDGWSAANALATTSATDGTATISAVRWAVNRALGKVYSSLTEMINDRVSGHAANWVANLDAIAAIFKANCRTGSARVAVQPVINWWTTTAGAYNPAVADSEADANHQLQVLLDGGTSSIDEVPQSLGYPTPDANMFAYGTYNNGTYRSSTDGTNPHPNDTGQQYLFTNAVESGLRHWFGNAISNRWLSSGNTYTLVIKNLSGTAWTGGTSPHTVSAGTIASQTVDAVASPQTNTISYTAPATGQVVTFTDTVSGATETARVNGPAGSLLLKRRRAIAA